MARPRKDNPADAFTSTEMAIGAGIPPRSFGVLQESGLAPEPVGDARGKSTARFWDSFGLGQAALAGAFFGSGFELLTSARLANAIAAELGAAYGDLPSNLTTFWRDKEFHRRYPDFPWVRSGEIQDVRDDFWFHHYLRTQTSAYVPRQHMKGDFYIEIADRQYVFTNAVRDLGIKYIGGMDAEPSYRIHGLGRGGDAYVKSIPDEVALPFDHPEAAERYTKIQAEFLAARANAVGLLSVNISLAIRNALDAVHEHRLKVRSQFDWTATAKPKPGRYDGVDENGYPLDPAHPWNRDLPPLERAKRLVEIEEYITKREAQEKGDDTS